MWKLQWLMQCHTDVQIQEATFYWHASSEKKTRIIFANEWKFSLKLQQISRLLGVAFQGFVHNKLYIAIGVRYPPMAYFLSNDHTQEIWGDIWENTLVKVKQFQPLRLRWVSEFHQVHQWPTFYQITNSSPPWTANDQFHQSSEKRLTLICQQSR